jgi:alpha-mannosidase
VFGYSGSLPQIAVKSGMKYFLTTKISWSQFNRFPYDTFYWRGIDGTELLTHFVTTPDPGAWFYTYNGRLEPSEVKGIWDQYRQKEVNDELLLLYGWGDGGGGPTKEMLESARVLKNLPGLPEVQLGKAEDYFQRLESRLNGSELPVWDGELYLEYHRGTYTSQAYSKRANRKAEVLYHSAEWLSALASLLAEDFRYPTEELQEGWELILLNQFHDILPGSSIREVYEDSREQYDTLNRIGEGALEQAGRRLLSGISADRDSLVVFNPLSWERSEVIELPWSAELAGKTILKPDGRPSPVQVVEREGERKILVEAGEVPSLGYRSYPLVPAKPAGSAEEDGLNVSASSLENRYYRIQLNNRGQLVSLFDKENRREVLAPGSKANLFQAFEDKPMAFDAWDIDIYYQEKSREIGDLVETQVEEAGPLRGVLLLRWRFYDSEIIQRLTLYRDSRRIDFRTQVDWHERQVLLKVAFPVAVRSTRAAYDIQFGSIERPTHWNTSWDLARFETVGQKWADLSEGDYGVALLNDCKYGHDIKNNVMRLTLIKSAIKPDEQADQGWHEFTYSLLPHAGDWRQGGVVPAAYELNVPLLNGTVPGGQAGPLPPVYRFVEADSDHVIVETVKKAEGEEAWVVRAYEYKQSRSSEVTLNFGQAIRKAVECNLVEEEDRPVAYEGCSLRFPILPYEIKTFKVWF